MGIAVNAVVLAGNLTRDVETGSTNSGKIVSHFTLAINEGTKDKPQVTFVDITAWDKTADFCGKYLQKGSAVLIEGALREEKWQDRQTGQNRSKITVTARRVQMLGGGGGKQNEQNQRQQVIGFGTQYSNNVKAQPPMPPMEYVQPNDDENLPF